MSDHPNEDSPRSWGIEDYANLYQAGRFLSDANKRLLGLLMPVPVYLQDPWVAEQARRAEDELISKRVEWNPLSTIEVQCEPDLADGPTSARLAVVDYNAETDKLEKPAGWDRDRRRFYARLKGKKVYLTQEHCDLPQFHQVNVWAIVQSILNMYEQTWVLGRAAPWAFQGNRLILMPHLGENQNAYYNRNRKAIQFFYFHTNGRRIYTCLSHDIIAHETGHAILDGLRPHYIENSSLQTTAFHEFVADTTAIMAALLNNELRFQAVQESAGDLSRDQILSGLAEEFGYYSYGRPYLRTAQDPRTISDVQASFSPYDWSQVLTGAMFDILKEILVIRKTKPLAGGRQPSLQQAYNLISNRFRRVVFQPLDYLPPVDVQFSDYARAVLRADEIAEPCDEDGYRSVMRRVFQQRGIDCTEPDQPSRLNFYPYEIERLTRSHTDAYHFLNENRRQLCIPADQDIAVADLYQTDKTAWGLGKLPREIVIQYTWREDVTLKGHAFERFEGQHVSLLCGGTLVFDSRGNLLSWQRKPGAGKQEVGKRLRKYCLEERERGNQRREQLLAYIKRRIASGEIGLQAELPGEDGLLRLEVAPNLRQMAVK